MEFIEENCKIDLNGNSFESGGSYLLTRKDTGKKVGLFYAYENDKKVGNWHGDKKVNAIFGHTWRSNFMDKRQSVYFTWEGTRFYGVYYKENSDIIRAREISS